MTDPADDVAAGWARSNDAFLSAALAWLRLGLERLASPVYPPPQMASAYPAPSPEPAPPSLRDRFLRRTPSEAPSAQPPLLALPPASEAVTEAQIAEAAKAMEAAEQA